MERSEKYFTGWLKQVSRRQPHPYSKSDMDQDTYHAVG